MKLSDAEELELKAYGELVTALMDVVGRSMSPPKFADLTVLVMSMLASAYEEGYEMGYEVGTERRTVGKVN